MPVAAVTNVLATGLLPMFTPGLAPDTIEEAGLQWAQAYVGYAVAGGVADASTRRATLAANLTAAFAPDPGGGGPALFLEALSTFWMGLSVPEQVGTVTAFTPSSTDVTNLVPEDASPQDLARGLASVIASLTLGSVFVTVPGPAVVPLL